MLRDKMCFLGSMASVPARAVEGQAPGGQREAHLRDNNRCALERWWEPIFSLLPNPTFFFIAVLGHPPFQFLGSPSLSFPIPKAF